MYDPARDQYKQDQIKEKPSHDGEAKGRDLKESEKKGIETSKEVSRDETGNNNSSQIRDQGKRAHGSDEEPASPKRKFKRPSRKVSDVERNRQNEQARKLIEKHETQKLHIDPVKQHYNERPNYSREARNQSPIIKLRLFNNLIKSLLIQRYGNEHDVVLDLACGKGGDIQKWQKQRVSGIIGIDIADKSIQQAKERISQLRHKSFWDDFCVGDPFTQRVEDIVHPKAFPVDVVSMQFALHYSYGFEDHARCLIYNISRSLKTNGYFIGTMPNSEFIFRNLKKLKEQQERGTANGVGDGNSKISWGNEVYSLTFKEFPPSLDEEEMEKSPYGHGYNFYLKDAVDAPEYIVPFKQFEQLCKEYGLKLIFRQPFLEMFESEMESRPREFRQLFERMFRTSLEDRDSAIDEVQKEAVSVYLAFAFQKIGDAEKEVEEQEN